jgi:diaminopimelate epimerase
MRIHFFKYQGTGNDFVLLDNRTNAYNNLSTENIRFLCDRHFGIGGDGLMFLNKSSAYDFEMKYYNSDGNESTMCGNGGRCMTAFAKRLAVIHDQARFVAIDGEHDAYINEHGFVRLRMNDVNGIAEHETYMQLNTGSPHYVYFTEDVKDFDMKKEGALIRYSPLYKDEGINVNFVEQTNNKSIFVRTYERGVEDETLSCGTGVTASALCLIKNMNGQHKVNIHTPGGDLVVECNNVDGQHFNDIWLCGKAEFVFEGDIEI